MNGVVAPYEVDGELAPLNHIDVTVIAALERRGIRPANRCSDEVFVRRVYLDVLGKLPEPEEVLRFLGDRSAGKRAALVEALFERDDFADYWAMRWCDVLRVKAEFPMNLWPNAVQAYHRFVRTAVRENMPCDRFARELLTSSGSNFRVPQVNFWRAVQAREPAAFAQAVALTFMGVRLEKWPEARRTEMAAFFSRVAYKRTREWKEEIVYSSPPESAAPLEAIFPDGTRAGIAAGEDPRRAFADWLLAPGNPYFARCIANRVWAWLMGRGVIHEPDDIRPENPPSNPALLSFLEQALVNARYDVRQLIRLILNSATYQRSSIPRSAHEEAGPLFAHHHVRRLEAEVLVDALCQITGTGEQYSSTTPEPFSFIPEEARCVSLADGSITSPLLEMFGRPARDTGLASERSNEPTEAQRLHLLNSTDVIQRIRQGFLAGKILPKERGRPREAVERIYLRVLSRRPTEAEWAAIERYSRASRLAPLEAGQDLVWALLNSKEFLYRH